jgi:transposase
MSCEPDVLPKSLDDLQAHCREQDTVIAQLRVQIDILQEKVNLLTAKRFGRRSERYDPNQGQLFNEAEVLAPTLPEQTTIEVPAHKRQRGGRRSLPSQLPRVDIVHELAPAQQVCEHDGHPLTVIGEEITEQLDIIPARVRVLRHIRKKYGCALCQIGVKTAELPAQPLPKSLASPGLLAHIVTAKFQDGLPLYRQEKIFERMGIELSRTTQASWIIKLGALCQPIINLFYDHALTYDILSMDETTVQVLKEPDKPPTSKSYMWVLRGGPPGKPVIVFNYDATRSQTVPLRLLQDYQGYLQADGYEAYAVLAEQPGIVLLGCMAHARRKFDEALKAQGKSARAEAGENTTHARHAMDVIQALYRIERQAKDFTPEARYLYRLEKAKPLFDQWRLWLDAVLPTVPPQSATGKALTYLHNQWQKLIRYLDDGRLSIDNNRTENVIRPFVVGRKAWLFSDTVAGANASAALYSIVETAKANGHEPYFYLRHLITELPKAQCIADYEALLPFNITPAQINRT